MYKDRLMTSVGLRPMIGFVLSAGLLAAAALGLRPAMAALGRHYTKEPAAVRRPLRAFDLSCLSSFQEGWTAKLSETDAEIETEEYALVNLKNTYPAGGVDSGYLLVTYYDNPRDKVPHTPDVCYRQGGGIVKQKKTVSLDIPGLAPGQSPVKATLLVLDMKLCDRVVIFLFVAEGEFRRTRGQVRWVLGVPGNKHAYFAKIEASAACPRGTDPTEAIRTTERLVRESVPLLMKEYLPDAAQLARR